MRIKGNGIGWAFSENGLDHKLV